MSNTKKQKTTNEHLNGMHKHLVALRKSIYFGDGIKKLEARKIYEKLIEVMEALDFALDSRRF